MEKVDHLTQALIEAIEAQAEKEGVKPPSIVRRATSLGWHIFAKWKAGQASPTLRTASAIYNYINSH